MIVQISLTPEETQTVVNALAARPYSEVAGLVPKIINQYNAAVQADKEAQSGLMNGKEVPHQAGVSQGA